MNLNTVNRNVLFSGSFCFVLIFTGLFLGGCGTTNPYPPGTFERGQFFVEEENFTDAVPALETFVRHNPTDSLAVKAQFLKARTLMDLEQYPLAAVEFQILRKDYPTSPLVEDAYFYEGVAYYDQVGNIERDITGAYEARLHFLDFSHEFPNSRFMTEIVQYMRDISDLMVEKRLEQIKIYHQLRRYDAVAITLDFVLEDEPGSRILDEVLWQRAEIALKMEDFDVARTMYRRLVNEFPESKYVSSAQNALQDLQNDSGDS